MLIGQQGRGLRHGRQRRGVTAAFSCALAALAALAVTLAGAAPAGASNRECREPAVAYSFEVTASAAAPATAPTVAAAADEAAPSPMTVEVDASESELGEANLAEARLLLVLDQIPSGPRCGVPGAACYPDETAQLLELESLLRVAPQGLPSLALPGAIPLILRGDGHGPATSPARRLDRPPRLA
jgi:hypothetical protein